MRKLLLPAAAWAALVVAWPAAATTAPVQITRTGFVPSTTTITAGDTVSWTNADTSAHQVVANNGTFSSPVLQPGQSYSYTFRTAGKTQYHDAMQKNRKGTVVVNAPPASVTLRASRGAVVYGGGLTLSGVVSSQKAGEAVVVEMQECGKPTFTRLAAATTANGGAWSLAVKPATTTTYQARWKSVSSAPVTVKARPRVRL